MCQVTFKRVAEDDPRGWCRVHDRDRLREVCADRIRTHPFRF